tara:strand:- start:2082 stop:2186 length:105 start_codon:yes stop_codon:yes gene_type:complete
LIKKERIRMKEQWTIIEEGKEDKVFILEVGEEEE